LTRPGGKKTPNGEKLVPPLSRVSEDSKQKKSIGQKKMGVSGEKDKRIERCLKRGSAVPTIRGKVVMTSWFSQTRPLNATPGIKQSKIATHQEPRGRTREEKKSPLNPL